MYRIKFDANQEIIYANDVFYKIDSVYFSKSELGVHEIEITDQLFNEWNQQDYKFWYINSSNYTIGNAFHNQALENEEEVLIKMKNNFDKIVNTNTLILVKDLLELETQDLQLEIQDYILEYKNLL